MTISEFSINHIICLLQRRLRETMRASVVLLFAFLALAFVAAYAADEVSTHANIQLSRLTNCAVCSYKDDKKECLMTKIFALTALQKACFRKW